MDKFLREALAARNQDITKELALLEAEQSSIRKLLGIVLAKKDPLVKRTKVANPVREIERMSLLDLHKQLGRTKRNGHASYTWEVARLLENVHGEFNANYVRVHTGVTKNSKRSKFVPSLLARLAKRGYIHRTGKGLYRRDRS